MTCPRCGAAAVGDEAFCTSCGTPLQVAFVTTPTVATTERAAGTHRWLVLVVAALAALLVAGVLVLVLGGDRDTQPQAKGTPRSVAGESPGQPTGDFTGDGRGDVAINTADGIVVQASTGSTFAPTGLSAPAADEAARGDVNGDGKADLLMVSLTGTDAVVSVLLADEDSFAPATEHALQGLGADGRLLVGDVNGDGYDDAVGIGADRVTVLAGGRDGLGASQDWGPAPSYPGLSYPLLGRFTDDDVADLLVVHQGPAGVDFSLHQGGAAWFGEGRTWHEQPHWKIEDMRPVVGDFDGDRLSDVGELGRPGGGGADIMVLRSTGTSFESAVQWMRNSAVDWATTRIVSGDFDGDGRSDVLTLAPGPSGDGIAEVRISDGSTFGDAHIWSSARWGDDPRPVGLGTGKLGQR